MRIIRDVISRSNNNYFELIVGLFKAAQELHAYFRSTLKKDVRPVVFLRDDIFDLLRDNDKPKWEDKKVDLNWNSLMLRDFLAFRINKAAGSSDPPDFRENWQRVFSVETTRTNNRHNRTTTTMNYILRSTYMRPRDVISYVRAAAKLALNQGDDRIDNPIIKDAERLHSGFMRNEIIAEMYPVVPHVSEILDMLAELRKVIVTRKEFNDNYRNLVKQIHSDGAFINEQRALDFLFYFGAIGNVTTGSNHQIFRYDSPRAKYNRRENICVHRSLLKSLDIY